MKIVNLTKESRSFAPRCARCEDPITDGGKVDLQAPADSMYFHDDCLTEKLIDEDAERHLEEWLDARAKEELEQLQDPARLPWIDDRPALDTIH